MDEVYGNRAVEHTVWNVLVLHIILGDLNLLQLVK